jgi:hypothetical protein
LAQCFRFDDTKTLQVWAWVLPQPGVIIALPLLAVVASIDML